MFTKIECNTTGWVSIKSQKPVNSRHNEELLCLLLPEKRVITQITAIFAALPFWNQSKFWRSMMAELICSVSFRVWTSVLQKMFKPDMLCSSNFTVLEIIRPGSNFWALIMWNQSCIFIKKFNFQLFKFHYLLKPILLVSACSKVFINILNKIMTVKKNTTVSLNQVILLLQQKWLSMFIDYASQVGP